MKWYRSSKPSWKRTLRRGTSAPAAVASAVVSTLSGRARRSRRKYSIPQPNRELKYNINTINGSVVSSVTGGSALVTLLNGVAQGTDVSNRVGNKITNRSVYYRVSCSCDSTSLGTYAQQSDAMLVSLVYDKTPNGTAPTYGQIFLCANNQTDPYALPAPNYSDRFTILASDLLSINLAGPNISTATRSVKVNLPTKYIGTGATIASIETGALYLVAVTQNSTSQTRIILNLRVLYDDE